MQQCHPAPAIPFIISQYFMNDEILGCLLGGAVGDAAGAPLEFYDFEMTDDAVSNAMGMSGGGALNIGVGQLTDDSELAISLMSSLVLHASEEGFPADTVALSYILHGSRVDHSTLEIRAVRRCA